MSDLETHVYPLPSEEQVLPCMPLSLHFSSWQFGQEIGFISLGRPIPKAKMTKTSSPMGLINIMVFFC